MLPERRVWVVDGASGDMEVGDFRCRIIRNGPYSHVKVRTHEPRDDEGNLIGDVVYEVTVDGKPVNYLTEFPQGLFGFYAEDFAAMESDDASKALDKKMTEQVNAKSGPVDLMTSKLPF